MSVIRLADKTKPAANPAIVAMLEGLLERARAGELSSLTCQLTTITGFEHCDEISDGDAPWLIALQVQHLHLLRAGMFEEG